MTLEPDELSTGSKIAIAIVAFATLAGVLYGAAAIAPERIEQPVTGRASAISEMYRSR